MIRVHNVTGAPLLSSAEYGCLFHALANELRDRPYHLTVTSRAVRDRCIEMGQRISRQSIGFVLRGIAYRQGFGSGQPKDPGALATVFADNVLALAAAAQLELSDDERSNVMLWLTGDVTGDG